MRDSRKNTDPDFSFKELIEFFKDNPARIIISATLIWLWVHHFKMLYLTAFLLIAAWLFPQYLNTAIIMSAGFGVASAIKKFGKVE